MARPDHRSRPGVTLTVLIVIDAPPPAMAAETGVLARQVDGILVVRTLGGTRRKDLSDLIARMAKRKYSGAS